MAARKKHKLTEYETQLRIYHQKSARHVVVMEADLSEDKKRKLFSDSDDLRQCGNKLLGIMKRNLEQLFRTKRYRNLQTLYGALSEEKKRLEKLDSPKPDDLKQLKITESDLKKVSASLAEMQDTYHVTWDFCRKTMEELRLQYKTDSIFALSRAEDIWTAVSKVLYSNGMRLRFKKRGELPEIRAKQRSRGLIIKTNGTDLNFRYGDLSFQPIIPSKDIWLQDEVSKDLTRRILLPEEIVHAHDEGIIHFHDADYFAQKEHNCDLINLEDMLMNGTVISETMIERPHSFYTACNITTQIIAQVASNQYGPRKSAVL